MAQELADGGYSALAAAEVKSNLMDAVQVEHDERVPGGRDGVVASVAGSMPKLHPQSEGLECDRLVIRARPSLRNAS